MVLVVFLSFGQSLFDRNYVRAQVVLNLLECLHGLADNLFHFTCVLVDVILGSGCKWIVHIHQSFILLYISYD